MVKRTKNLPAVGSLAVLPARGSIDNFIAWCHQVPILNAQEEHTLVMRYYEKNDLEAVHKLVIHNMRFVIHIARKYKGYGLALNDLVQEGSIGLMKAIKRFDPNKNVRLISFAVYWIRAEIHEFILKNWRIVKVATTKAQRKLFFNLRSMKKRLAQLDDKEAKEISQNLNVKTKEVLEMEKRMGAHDVSFDPLPTESSSEDETALAPAETLSALNADPAETFEEEQWQDNLRQKLHQALEKLDPRSIDIIRARWFVDKKASLHELAKKHNISAERVRQIESKALTKLRTISQQP